MDIALAMNNIRLRKVPGQIFGRGEETPITERVLLMADPTNIDEPTLVVLEVFNGRAWVAVDITDGP